VFSQDEILQTFRAQSEENLAALEEALVGLESRPGDDELISKVFRVVHTVKGDAGSLGFQPIADVAHAIEDALEPVRTHARPVTSALATLLLQGVDALRVMVGVAATGGDLEAAPASLLKKLKRLSRKNGGPAEPEAPSAAEAPASAATDRVARTLRVDIETLDQLLNLTGEIAIARGRLQEVLESDSADSSWLALEIHQETNRLYADLQELVMKVRLVPIGSAFRPHVRTVRDAAAAHGKKAELVMEGEDVEVDMKVIEHVRDPLLHMIRNAVDHGIETTAARKAAGKDACGRIVLRAYHETGIVVIQIEDDGAGLDREKILTRARERGLVDTSAAPGDADVHRLIFEPGFSTADAVTDLSGRGVGMDVVKRNVEMLRGALSVESRPGQGTTVTLRVPLTLAIIQGFQVDVGGETYVVPLECVVECLALPPDETAKQADYGVINLRDKPVPYLRLRRHMKVAAAAPAREHVVILQSDGLTAGLAVDALLGESQTVVKPLGQLFRRIPGLFGSAILGSGRVALILDVPGLLHDVLQKKELA
jgi:two-component system, chemotaxis family, sensor kinase CheA